jgi:hypothetical protein
MFRPPYVWRNRPQYSKVHSRTGHEGPGREYRNSSTLSLTSALGGVKVKGTLWPLYPRERPGTHCTGGWVGLRAGLNGCGKSCHSSVFDPRTVQPVASHYTDWAVPTHKQRHCLLESQFGRHYGSLLGRAKGKIRCMLLSGIKHRSTDSHPITKPPNELEPTTTPFISQLHNHCSLRSV